MPCDNAAIGIEDGAECGERSVEKMDVYDFERERHAPYVNAGNALRPVAKAQSVRFFEGM